jgi:hypothetical protein
MHKSHVKGIFTTPHFAHAKPLMLSKNGFNRHTSRGTEYLPGERHLHRTSHWLRKPLTVHARPRHVRQQASPLSSVRWRGTEPCFAPDFALLLLAAVSLLALGYLLGLLHGVQLINPSKMPGYPALT